MEMSASEVMQLNLVLVSLFLRSRFTNCCIGQKKKHQVVSVRNAQFVPASSFAYSF